MADAPRDDEEVPDRVAVAQAPVGRVEGDAAGHPVYFAWGYGGQFIFVVPDLDLVVVTTSATDTDRERGHLDAIHALLAEEIVPAVGGGATDEEAGNRN